jgi:UDP-glucose 4-epimerase
MHLAAYAYVKESIDNPLKYYNNNFVNGMSLINEICKANTFRRNCNQSSIKLIFSSSCATYGNADKIPIREDHPQHPINPYGKSKLFLEQYIYDISNRYDLECVILRYFNAAGADPSGLIGELHIPETHLIPIALEAAKTATNHVNIYGDDYSTKDGTCVRDYIHVNDIAQAHVNAMNKLLIQKGDEKTFVSAYNLGNGNGYSVREVIETVEKVTGRNIPIRYADKRAGNPPVLIASSELALEELCWKPRFPNIEEIIVDA